MTKTSTLRGIRHNDNEDLLIVTKDYIKYACVRNVIKYILKDVNCRNKV